MLPSQQYRQPDAGVVLAALHEITARRGYLPEDDIRQVAGELGVPLSQVFSAATFYAGFSFEPVGHHRLQVCEGTACYVKGAPALMAQLESELGIASDETTDDLAFTLKRVRCVGSCGLAPVLRLDGETYGRLAPGDLGSILNKYR
jgi:NADH-quinone oxidoreductase subunit E/NADP-reducing hydrogenase subunit HndA